MSSNTSVSVDPLRLNDPFVRRVAQFCVLLFLLTLMSPAAFAVYLYLGTRAFHGVPEPWVDVPLGLFHNLSSFPTQLLQLLLAALPILLAQVCYRTASPSRLNLIGRVSFLIVLTGVLVALLGLLLINPQDRNAQDNISGGQSTLTALRSGCEQVARSAVMYALMFFGLRPRGAGGAS